LVRVKENHNPGNARLVENAGFGRFETAKKEFLMNELLSSPQSSGSLFGDSYSPKELVDTSLFIEEWLETLFTILGNWQLCHSASIIDSVIVQIKEVTDYVLPQKTFLILNDVLTKIKYEHEIDVYYDISSMDIQCTLPGWNKLLCNSTLWVDSSKVDSNHVYHILSSIRKHNVNNNN
jgi:hypothetical protein